MLLPRARLLPFILSGAVALAACSGDAPEITPEIAAELGRSDARAAALAEFAESASTPREVERGDAIALGYLERHRLGLGSPWRLIDYALNDTRLADSARHQVAWSILARTIAEDGNERYAEALDYLATGPADTRAGSGRAHADLIDSVIARASDPRIGELTLRLAYAIAASENTVARQGAIVGTHVAALARDRHLARQDALTVLRAAEAAGVDPVWLIGPWRSDRRFLAERPVLEALPAEAELEAIREVPLIVAALREIAADSSASSLRRRRAARAPAPPSATSGSESLLGSAAAARLAELAAKHGAPPQAPVLLALRGYRSRLLAVPAGSRTLERRQAFVSRVSNEENLVAEYALLAGDGEETSVADLAVLAAAVSLRPHAQEEVWFPGMPGASVAEIKNAFGLASVSFDNDVPAEWRPFYLRTLARGIEDVRRVLPGLSLDGAGIHFGESVMRDAALALHDPATRTIYLPIASGAGALAHEIMHDLDWQFARSRFGRQGGYGTDRAVREHSGRTVTSLQGLTAATLVAPMPQNGFSPPHAQRPAEVFARSADWFIAASLAREGRVNGYLSAVQDELLPGYVAAEPPGPTGAAGSALLDLLDDMTVVPETTREWFLARFGRDREPRALNLVRALLDAPLSRDHDIRARSHVLDPLRELLPRRACGTWSSNAGPRTRGPLRELLDLAADARARGIVVDRHAIEGATRDAASRPPRSTVAFDREVARVRAELLARLDADAAEQRPTASIEQSIAPGCVIR